MELPVILTRSENEPLRDGRPPAVDGLPGLLRRDQLGTPGLAPPIVPSPGEASVFALGAGMVAVIAVGGDPPPDPIPGAAYAVEPERPKSKGFALLRGMLQRGRHAGPASLVVRPRRFHAILRVRGPALVLEVIRLAGLGAERSEVPSWVRGMMPMP